MENHRLAGQSGDWDLLCRSILTPELKIDIVVQE